MDTILVIAAREDWPTDRVVRTLTDRGAKVFRIDAADFPTEVTLTGRINKAGGWSGQLASSYRAVDLDKVSACYYRTPHPFRLDPGMSGPERKFAAAQARAGLGGIIAALDCRWVSHPSAMSRAEYKPVQLAAAQAAGLTIPPTLITNDPGEVRAFAESTDGPLICKPVASPLLIEDDTLKTVYTHLLTAQDLGDLTGIGSTAHLFQAWVEKAYEVRLTVVGDRMLAAEVHAASGHGHIDWRADYRSLTYKTTETPGAVAESVRALMDSLGLRFAALDFVVSPDGAWTFLEANPCGQWDWIQGATGLPIGDAIADELQGAAT